ncbi:MAG: adenylate kinase [Clostridiaceae bacterium]|nr:adenylate kinase [Clostridiaceae bacterium]
MQVILLGPPGSGKGTMASDLIRIYQIPHISTGDIFRQNIREKTELGRQADQYIKTGALVPDILTIAMVEDRLNQPDCAKGFLLDGFPRTRPQAEALERMEIVRKNPLTAVVNIRVSDQVILDRLTARRVCPGCGRSYNLVSLQPQNADICDDCGQKLIQRDDDKPETIKNRLKTYYQQTEPLIQFYREQKLLFDVDNEGAVGSSLAVVQKALNERI